MSNKISRRKLIRNAAVLGAGTTFGSLAPAFADSGLGRSNQAKPIVISSSNGNAHKNGGTETCVVRAYRMISEGADVLDAVIAGVNIVELDPADSSVGFGGLPNADGVVQLDSCCMHGPKKWAGGVASIEGVSTPSRVAQLVASTTDHHLLVGKGAQDFARVMGFTIQADLNTEASRRAHMEWKRRTDPGHYLDPNKRSGGGEWSPEMQATFDMANEGWIDPEHIWGTINCCAMSAKGEICGVTTTSGLAFKIPGRVGDSPILGAGLYVDNAVGAAGSTGRGEANLFGLCSYLVVEEMRRGAHPKDAGLAALKRVAENTIEKRLLNDKGQPNFGLNFYALDAKGRFAGVSMQGNARFAVCDEKGPRLEDCTPLFS